MAREEVINSRDYQVSKAALEYYNEHHQDKDIDLTDAFEAEAKWADKTIIEKACEWIESAFVEICDMSKIPYNVSIYTRYRRKIDLINDFKKAMEL